MDHRFLQRRGGRFYYCRRVPSLFAGVDARTTIRLALRTQSCEVARLRRDALAAADDEFWKGLVRAALEPNGLVAKHAQASIAARYSALRTYALASEPGDPGALVILTAPSFVENRSAAPIAAPAALAANPLQLPGQIRISAAYRLYHQQISASRLAKKSALQRNNWFKPKDRAVAQFIAVCGDLPVFDISRADARRFHGWWAAQLSARDLHPHTANRSIGNLHTLLHEYFVFAGQEDQLNPFRRLRFNEPDYRVIPPFSNAWVRKRLLVPHVYSRVHPEAALIFLALIETGCRPSEIANLTAGRIHLGSPAPFIEIRPGGGRTLKSPAASREIPLVGVSLEAMRRAPDGFARFRDRGDYLSDVLMALLKREGLMESADHRVYSLRHAFEERMLEGGLDYGLRCRLMGHRNSRPAYGSGGSISFRRRQLEKIAHPVPKEFLEFIRGI